MSNCIIPGYKAKEPGFKTVGGRSLSKMMAIHAAAFSAMNSVVRGRVGQQKQKGKK